MSSKRIPDEWIALQILGYPWIISEYFMLDPWIFMGTCPDLTFPQLKASSKQEATNRPAFRNTSSPHNSLLQATSSLIVCPGHLLFLPTTGIAGNCALICGKTACVKGEVWTLKNLGTTVLIGAGHVKTFDCLVPLLLVVEWMRLLLVCNINFHLNSQLTELFPNNNHHPGSNKKTHGHVVFF